MTPDTKLIIIDLARVREEAKRLNALGWLFVRFLRNEGSILSEDGATLDHAHCVGFAIDSAERDCLLFQTTLKVKKIEDVRVTRCIPAARIIEIRRAER